MARPVLERIRLRIEGQPELIYPDPDPWFWKGGTSYGVPRIWYEGKSRSVLHILYRELVGPLAPREHLRLTDRLNVNPYFANLSGDSVADFFDTPSEYAELGEELDEVCTMLEKEFAVRPFHSMEQIRERFEFVFDDLEDADIIQALKATGLDRHIARS